MVEVSDISIVKEKIKPISYFIGFVLPFLVSCFSYFIMKTLSMDGINFISNFSIAESILHYSDNPEFIFHVVSVSYLFCPFLFVFWLYAVPSSLSKEANLYNLKGLLCLFLWALFTLLASLFPLIVGVDDFTRPHYNFFYDAYKNTALLYLYVLIPIYGGIWLSSATFKFVVRGSIERWRRLRK